LPELPEVEAVRRALQPVMERARFERVLVRRPDLRVRLPRKFAARLEGQTVQTLGRRGKYLLAELSSGDVLVMHLGMSGSFRVEVDAEGATSGNVPDERGSRAAHDHVVFRMSAGATITFNDPRRFGSIALVTRNDVQRHRALGALGPEPLGPGFDAAVLARACKGKKTSLKAALSDQRVLAGLGNIYVCETLHRARLSPRRRAGSIATSTGAPRAPAYRLVTAIKKVMADAIHRATTPRKNGPDGRDEADFPNRFRVYDREGRRCLTARCTGTVRRIVQAGRSTFFCPLCQR
jgi:formamidopyrimidine-DNA glycosylase